MAWSAPTSEIPLTEKLVTPVMAVQEYVFTSCALCLKIVLCSSLNVIILHYLEYKISDFSKNFKMFLENLQYEKTNRTWGLPLWHSVSVGKTISCNAGISSGCQFKSWLMQF